MVKQQQQLPTMPEIGHPESYYARGVHAADKAGDVHTRESLKVGQYITLALDYRLRWAKKLRYFEHALRRHCNPPQLASDEVWMFYRNLAHLVREQSGKEALRLASEEDDRYAERLRMGGTRDRIAADAKPFFLELMGAGDKCPDYFLEGDWEQLKILRNQWVLDYRTIATGAPPA
jgi:hypothetical protein